MTRREGTPVQLLIPKRRRTLSLLDTRVTITRSTPKTLQVGKSAKQNETIFVNSSPTELTLDANHTQQHRARKELKTDPHNIRHLNATRNSKRRTAYYTSPFISAATNTSDSLSQAPYKALLEELPAPNFKVPIANSSIVPVR